MEIIVASCLLFAAGTLIAQWLQSQPDVGSFLRTLFVSALLLRAGVGLAIFLFRLEELFGPDAIFYHWVGQDLALFGFDHPAISENIRQKMSPSSSGWGMYYWVASVYMLGGISPLLLQFVHCISGALVPILIFYIAEQLYGNRQVSQRAAIMVAYFPSLILWSAQGLKDPLILFCICVVVYASVCLRKGITLPLIVIAGAGLFGLYALRFYVFYIMVAALVVSIVMGSAKDFKAFFRQTAAFAIIGGGLLYSGAGGYVSEHVERYDLNWIQSSRSWGASAATSGFGADLDVRAEGAIPTVLSVGMVYVLFAPFPWQITSFRQAITLPEMLIWWSFIPMMIIGIGYTIRYRLSECSAILIFTSGLLIVYSFFLSNVGTAYRQRAQVLPFFLLFVAVGLVLRDIKRKAAKLASEKEQGKFASPAAAGRAPV